MEFVIYASMGVPVRQVDVAVLLKRAVLRAGASLWLTDVNGLVLWIYGNQPNTNPRRPTGKTQSGILLMCHT